MERTIRGALSMHFASYAQGQRMPRYVYRAARQLQRCRTAEMGGHIQACPHGHFERRVFHSCRHRLCPQCNALPREQWLMKMRERLIDCAHHHLIFTIPHDLLELWRWNRAWFTQQLFATVAATLHELTQDDRHMGARCGFTLALHTWGRSLSFHPHIHCLITDGGVNEDGRWQGARRSCFLPARVVMAVFRGKLLAALRTAVRQEQLALPRELSSQRTLNLINRLGRLKWNVHLRERYAHGGGVMTYLARYLKGGVLSNHQLVAVDTQQIVFRYVRHAGEQRSESTTMQLKPAHFIARYLQHTPLPGVPVVRHYGLYASAKSSALTVAREAHQQAPVMKAPVQLRCAQFLNRLFPQQTSAMRCPHCQAELILRESIARQQGPPCTLH